MTLEYLAFGKVKTYGDGTKRMSAPWDIFAVDVKPPKNPADDAIHAGFYTFPSNSPDVIYRVTGICEDSLSKERLEMASPAYNKVMKWLKRDVLVSDNSIHVSEDKVRTLLGGEKELRLNPFPIVIQHSIKPVLPDCHDLESVVNNLQI